MNKILAKDIANETEKVNKSFSQIMNLAIQLKEENEGKQRLLDRRLERIEKLNSEILELRRLKTEPVNRRVDTIVESAKAEADSLKPEELKPALRLALGQRDFAMRSVHKLDHITTLLTAWDRGNLESYTDFIPTADLGDPTDFDIIRHIIDNIIHKKGDV